MASEVEGSARAGLGAEDGRGIQSDQIAAVEVAVIVAGVSHVGLVPRGIARGRHEGDLKVQMSPVGSDSLAGVRSATHAAQGLACLDRGAHPDP